MKFKFKVKNLNLKIFSFFTFYFSLFTFVFPIQAAQSTPSAKTASPSSTLIQKLDALKKEIASKATQIKKEVHKKIENKAFVGTTMQIEKDSITLQTHQGVKTVLTNEYTKKSQFTLNDLSLNDFVAALGDVDDKGVLTAKKIIKFKKPQIDKSLLVWGQIQSANLGVINLKNKDKQIIKVLTSQETIFSLGGAEASFADAKLNKFIVAKGVLKNNLVTADFIYILSKGGSIKPEKKIATPSATTKK